MATIQSTDDVSVQWESPQQPAQNEWKRCLVKFNISSIPANAVISSATLNLYVLVNGSGDVTLYAKRFNSQTWARTDSVASLDAIAVGANLDSVEENGLTPNAYVAFNVRYGTGADGIEADVGAGRTYFTCGLVYAGIMAANQKVSVGILHCGSGGIAGGGEHAEFNSQDAASNKPFLEVEYTVAPITVTERVGALSQYGIGTEATAGTPVLAQHLLGVSSSSLRMYPEVVMIDEQTAVRSLREAVPGTVYGMGAWTMAVRHDKFTKVLMAHFGSPGSTGAGPYVHVFKTKQALTELDYSHTLYQNRGKGRIEVYTNAFVSSLNLRTSRDGAARILTATANWMTGVHATKAIWTWSAENEALTVAGAAAYDDDVPWVFDKGTLTLHGSTATCRMVDITRAWSPMTFKDEMEPSRGVDGVTVGDAVVTGAVEMLFSSEAEHKRFFAGAASPASPHGPGSAILPGTVKFDFSATGALYAGEGFKIEIDEAIWTSVDAPLTTRDAMIQRCELTGLYDGTDTAEMKLTVTNAEAAATVIATGTGIA